ncbi:gluconokinase [Hansschlegelia plantiphila]|uniref:Gluconokinase n=1 Tax=Hansschlegelia plantiphila TaxID=374655 RepID=A0A9W6J1M4_9HYPH|nr:gluconokinase [Hansschlegelia plantiphila]GLK67729.1 gluconokinase [Hansschlegelia plantiphila]
MAESGKPAAHGRVCVVVMGPSGVGKTTIARMLAERLGWTFAEADEFHPKANIEKMSAGIPLDDDDRAPWLALIRDWIGDEALHGRDTVVTCSALKRRYRDVLREAVAHVRFLALAAEPALIEARLASRTGHYMPASLLASQFAALEPLEDDEDGVAVDVGPPPEAIVRDALAALGIADAARSPVVAKTASRT